jgi:hypothetical protein
MALKWPMKFYYDTIYTIHTLEGNTKMQYQYNTKIQPPNTTQYNIQSTKYMIPTSLQWIQENSADQLHPIAIESSQVPWVPG